MIAVDFLAPLTRAQTYAQERAANLRAQLLEVQARQAELQIRQQQIDEKRGTLIGPSKHWQLEAKD